MRSKKKHFFIRLIPPRLSFALDMTEGEKALMQDHVVYWQGLLRKKIAFAYGPVFDPKGGYGIGIIEVDDETTAKAIMAQDPKIRKGMGFTFEIHAMRLVKK